MEWDFFLIAPIPDHCLVLLFVYKEIGENTMYTITLRFFLIAILGGSVSFISQNIFDATDILKKSGA